MPRFSDRLRSLLVGDPFGDFTSPPHADLPPQAIDGRTAAMRVLKEYLIELTYFRDMGPGRSPKRFQIPPENILTEYPEAVHELKFPSLSVDPGPAAYDPTGLSVFIEEDSFNEFAPGTALQWQAEYQEKFGLEIWAAERSERAAILAGLEVAFSPLEQMAGVRLRMLDYYKMPACFTLEDRKNEETDAVRGRRKAVLTIEVRFTLCQLIQVVKLDPLTVVNVDFDENGISIESEFGP
ncbi:MAG: hypothetical protein PVSMB8_04830 [Vulcanimicrobiaceae bacterium]